MQIDSTIALSQFVSSLPTFIAVILAWIHSNRRISDVHKRMDDMCDVIRAEGQSTRNELRAELRRVDEGHGRTAQAPGGA